MSALRDFLEFQWLTGVGLGWVTAIVVAAYLALIVIAATRSSDFIYEGAPDRRRRRDLRLWLIPVVVAQILLHIWLQ